MDGKKISNLLKAIASAISEDNGIKDVDNEQVDLLIKSEDPSHSREIVKGMDDEKMIAIEPLYLNVGEADYDKDGIEDSEIDKMISNFNKNINKIQGNIHHAMMTSAFKPTKAYRMPFDVYIGNPEEPESLKLIKSGQPIVEIQFSKTPAGQMLWEKRKSGILGGVSIGAKGVRVPNPDYEGNSDEK